MTVLTQVIRFQKSTGADGTTQDVNLNFTPKAIILFSSGGTADNVAEAHYQECIGFSDGTNQCCVATGSADNTAAGVAARQHESGRIWLRLSQTAPHTTYASYGTVAFGTNKVTFTWEENDAVATYITLWAIAGDDITGVKVNTVDVGRTTAGQQSYTGLGFTPQGDTHTALFTLAAYSISLGVLSQYSDWALGCATTASTTIPTGGTQWYMANVSEHGSDPSDTWRTAGTDRNFAVLNSTGAFDHYGWLHSWVADGFRMNWDDAPSLSTFKFSYLVIDGGNWDSGTLTTPGTPTNNVDKAVSVSSNPIKGAFFAGTSQITSAAIDTYAIYSLGATDGTNTSAVAAIDEDAQATTDSYRLSVSNNTGIYYGMSTNGAIPHVAGFDSFGTNSFRLDWVAVSAAHMLHWVVVADQFDEAVAVEQPSFKSFGSLQQSLTNNTGYTIFG